MRLLALSVILIVLLSLLITAALKIADLAYVPHLQTLSTAFAPGQCDQPCWRGVQIDKVGITGLKSALSTLSGVMPVSSSDCPGCWVIFVEGNRWIGEAAFTSRQILLDTDNIRSNFRFSDAVELFGRPQSVTCMVLHGPPAVPGTMDLTYIMDLQFENGIEVSTRYDINHFSDYLDPASGLTILD